jgi:hypothetical protein
LNECLTDVHVVAMHIILCRKGENHAETAGMRDRAESILKIPTILFILSMHMLTLDDETHFGRRRGRPPDGASQVAAGVRVYSSVSYL